MQEMARERARTARPSALARRIAGPVVLALALGASVAIGTSSAGADAVPAPRSTVPGVGSATPTDPAPTLTDPTSSAPTETPSDSSPTDSTPTPTGSDSELTSGGPVTGGVPGVDLPGISMTVTPQRDGDLDVRESVWLTSPVNAVQLAPPDLSTAGTVFATRAPKLVDVTLQAAGRDIPLQSTTATEPRQVPLAAASSTFVVTYTLRDAVVRSQPSVAGRALGAIRPLDLGGDPSLPVMAEVLGASTLAIVCPELGGVGETDCAGPTDTGNRLSNPVPVASALLQLQLNLDRA